MSDNQYKEKAEIAEKGIPEDAKEQHASVYYKIGQFLTGWSTVESLFQLLLEIMLGCSRQNAAILFHSVQSARGRTRLLDALAYENLNKADRETLHALLKRFRAPTRLRNELAHAQYNISFTTFLIESSSTANMSDYDGGDPVKRTPIDRAWENRIENMSASLHKLNLELWEFIGTLREQKKQRNDQEG
jgi:hypothetical protein